MGKAVEADDGFLCHMPSIEEELALAEQEMRSGSLDRAIETLLTLKSRLESQDSACEDDHARKKNLVKVLNNLGVVQKNQGDLESATESLESALEIAQNLEDEGVRLRSGILSNLGLLYSRRRIYAKGKAAFDEALSLAELNPGEVHQGFRVKLRNNRALFYVRFGELDRARDELSQSFEAAREAGSVGDELEREAWLKANLGMIHAELGEEEIYNPSRREELFRQARTMFLRSAELYGGQGYIHNKLKQLINVIEIEIRIGALEEARRVLREACREAERINSGRLLCEMAQMNVEIALRSGEREQLIDRVIELLETFKNFVPPDLPARRARLENMLRRAVWGVVSGTFVDPLGQSSAQKGQGTEQLKMVFRESELALAVNDEIGNERLIDSLDAREDELLARKYEGTLTLLEELQLDSVQTKKERLLGLDELKAPSDTELRDLEALIKKVDELMLRVDRLLEAEGMNETD